MNQAYKDTVLDIAPATYTSVQKDNQTELSKIVKSDSSLGFRRIGFGLVTAPAEFAPLLNEKLCHELVDAYEIAEQNELFIELYPTRIGDYIYCGDKYVLAEDFAVHTRCDAPLVNAVARYDGEVCLCCNFGATMGNVMDKSFLELWQSECYNELREAVNNSSDMPNPCRRCWWVNRWE